MYLTVFLLLQSLFLVLCTSFFSIMYLTLFLLLFSLSMSQLCILLLLSFCSCCYSLLTLTYLLFNHLSHHRFIYLCCNSNVRALLYSFRFLHLIYHLSSIYFCCNSHVISFILTVSSTQNLTYLIILSYIFLFLFSHSCCSSILTAHST